MNSVRNALTALLIFFFCAPAHADDLLMIRTLQNFPEAMLTLQNSIREHGYAVTRVQRIDVGLTGMGYKTDKYRVVFVAKPDEIHYLIEKHPVLAAYMPPQISIFAEHGETVLVTADPKIYEDMISDEKDKLIFKRWRSDIYSVFDDIRNANE